MEEVLNYILARLTAIEQRSDTNVNTQRNNNHNGMNSQQNTRVFVNTINKRPQHQKQQQQQHGQRWNNNYNNNNNRRTQNNTNKQPNNNSQTNQQYKTSNAAFGTVLKQLYRGTQLRHHITSWENVPKPVNKKIDELFAFLTPPVPDDELRARLDSLKLSIKQDIKTIIKTRINTQLDINTKYLNDTFLNDTDKQAAKELAHRVISRKYGRRTTANNIKEWLNTET